MTLCNDYMLVRATLQELGPTDLLSIFATNNLLKDIANGIATC